MLVCHCAAVSDGEIRDAVRRGARTFDTVAATLDVARDCTGCETKVRRLVDEVATAVPLPSAPAA